MYATRSRHFRRGNLWVQLYPRMKTFLLMPRQGLEPPTYHILGRQNCSVPWSKQLGHQDIKFLKYNNFIVTGKQFAVLSVSSSQRDLKEGELEG